MKWSDCENAAAGRHPDYSLLEQLFNIVAVMKWSDCENAAAGRHPDYSPLEQLLIASAVISRPKRLRKRRWRASPWLFPIRAAV